LASSAAASASRGAQVGALELLVERGRAQRGADLVGDRLDERDVVLVERVGSISSMLIDAPQLLADEQRRDELGATSSVSASSVVGVGATSLTAPAAACAGSGRSGRRRAAGSSAAAANVAALGGRSTRPSSRSAPRAQEVAERAVQLVDGGLEDRVARRSSPQPRAELVGERELARALAQALVALGSGPVDAAGGSGGADGLRCATARPKRRAASRGTSRERGRGRARPRACRAAARGRRARSRSAAAGRLPLATPAVAPALARRRGRRVRPRALERARGDLGGRSSSASTATARTRRRRSGRRGRRGGRRAQRVADAAQDLVADQVAVLVVDRLEVVEVDQDQRSGPASVRAARSISRCRPSCRARG
jgi:hypothetical protein